MEYFLHLPLIEYWIYLIFPVLIQELKNCLEEFIGRDFLFNPSLDNENGVYSKTISTTIKKSFNINDLSNLHKKLRGKKLFFHHARFTSYVEKYSNEPSKLSKYVGDKLVEEIK